ncbi:hypothetical protein [Burkholderia stagnalis]|uniref:hypothetical protein n=1 Tax=Burkholderia stagnalis TaxID=1503054 RepID=UPI0007543E3C|nr:hypothetical protein [Burkholderia stagnalis]KVX67789.1 hypothetical protein WT33_04240 [Burkholderia stagnalis]
MARAVRADRVDEGLTLPLRRAPRARVNPSPRARTSALRGLAQDERDTLIGLLGRVRGNLIDSSGA